MKNLERNGFTLLEMAIGLVILGLLLAPAISAYNLYEQNRKIEQTELSVNKANLAVEAFLSAYGRLPCPASRTASSGDAEYGFESRDPATGDCLHDGSSPPEPGVISEASDDTSGRLPSGDNLVVIGSIPYKSLNLDEDDMYDGYGARLTYAMTDILADPDDYAPNLGGISIEKIDDVTSTQITAIEPEHSGHYIILSHGVEKTGSFTGAGVQTGICSSALSEDEENCNDDSVFFISEKNVNFDDIVTFAGGSAITPWQYQDNVISNIHLKTGGGSV